MSTRRADLRAQGLEMRSAARDLAIAIGERVNAEALRTPAQQHDALREGAREHAAYQAHAPTLQEQEAMHERPGHTGEVPMPDGRYPQTLVELTLRVESLEAEVRRLVSLIGPHTPIGPGCLPRLRPPQMTDEDLERMTEAAREANDRP